MEPIVLSGDAEASYVRRVAASLQSARLNKQYPDARRLAAHVEALAPEVHRGLYDRLEVDPRSGLPTYKEWTRVQTDRTVALEALDGLGSLAHLEARAAEAPGAIYGKQLLKHHYYGDLVGREIAPLSQMNVALRRVDPGDRTAWFHITLDKLDVNGVFVRYAIDLGQRDSVWSRAVVSLEAEHARHTEELQTLIYRFSSVDAELTFAQLAARGSLLVERVAKGVVGPFYMAPAAAPAGLREILEAHPGAIVATCALDMAACDLATDRDNDPIEDPLATRLSEQGRAQYEEARAAYGYKVFKDRKFVVRPDLVDAVTAYCRAAGTRNIVYARRGA